MLGIELGERAKPYVDRLAEEGVLALTAGPKVLRLLPPLVITYPELDRVASAVRDVLKDSEVLRGADARATLHT